MFQKILVPLDGSPLAECALPVAARIARSTGASLILARVIYPPIEYTRYTHILAGFDELDSEIAQREIDAAKSYLRQIAMSKQMSHLQRNTYTSSLARRSELRGNASFKIHASTWKMSNSVS